MLIKAQAAQIHSMNDENKIFTIEATKSGDMFDYDLQIKTKTDAKMAKMIRFFEYVTIESNTLQSKYKPLEDPVKLEASEYVVSDPKAINDDFYEMKCPYDPRGKCIGQFEGPKPFDSEGVFNMYSQYTYQSLVDQGITNMTYLKSMNISDRAMTEFLSLEFVSGLVSQHSITSIYGKFKDGKIHGFVEINFLNGLTMQALAKDGILHGIARILEPSRPLRLRSR